jgi:hypothetical protein
LIYIDDAGSGSLVGGTIIGTLRKETGEYYYDMIPIRLYNQKYFKKKLYLDYTVKIIQDSFKKLGVSTEEPIAICRGYMFDSAREFLKKNKYAFESTKIEDPLQSVVEKTFEDYIISLGLPAEFIKFAKYPFHFHHLLRWVYADYSSRSKLCKTGWKSWQKYGYLMPVTYTDFVYTSKYYCLKCGKRIPDFSPVKVIKYTSNMPNILFLHKICY